MMTIPIMKQIGIIGTISNEVSADPFFSEEHIAMLERRIADMKAGRNMKEHDLIEVE